MNKVLIRHYGSGFMVLAPSPTTSEKSMREQETSLIICVHPSCPILFCTISSLTLVHNPYSFSVLWRSTDFIIYFVCACVCTYACMCVFLAWCMCVCEISFGLCLLPLKTLFPSKKKPVSVEISMGISGVWKIKMLRVMQMMNLACEVSKGSLKISQGDLLFQIKILWFWFVGAEESAVINKAPELLKWNLCFPGILNADQLELRY